jgi:hypothetical protein
MDNLTALALVLKAFPDTEIVAGADLATAAIEYAVAGWEVFPLAGKTPLLVCPINAAHKRARRAERCPGDCGNDGHGLKDATSSIEKIAAWWAVHPDANVGARVHNAVVVIDTDPRHGGEDHLGELEDVHGRLPTTLTARSGRGDGGRHRYFRHPGGTLGAARLPDGVDLKTSRGYVVLPPSIHTDSGLPYTWENAGMEPAPMPRWVAKLLVPEPVAPRHTDQLLPYAGESIADAFCAAHTWADVLVPHGWTAVRGGWRHPSATAAVSATVHEDCLFVYSTSTAFEATESGRPHGYTKFRAYAVLNHDGDLSAAAHALRAVA